MPEPEDRIRSKPYKFNIACVEAHCSRSLDKSSEGCRCPEGFGPGYYRVGVGHENLSSASSVDRRSLDEGGPRATR